MEPVQQMNDTNNDGVYDVASGVYHSVMSLQFCQRNHHYFANAFNGGTSDYDWDTNGKDHPDRTNIATSFARSRIVGAAVRLSYNGTTDNKQGRVYMRTSNANLSRPDDDFVQWADDNSGYSCQVAHLPKEVVVGPFDRPDYNVTDVFAEGAYRTYFPTMHIGVAGMSQHSTIVAEVIEIVEMVPNTGQFYRQLARTSRHYPRVHNHLRSVLATPIDRDWETIVEC